MQPKTINTLYWVFTGLFSLLMIFSAVGGLQAAPTFPDQRLCGIRTAVVSKSQFAARGEGRPNLAPGGQPGARGLAAQDTDGSIALIEARVTPVARQNPHERDLLTFRGLR